MDFNSNSIWWHYVLYARLQMTFPLQGCDTTAVVETDSSTGQRTESRNPSSQLPGGDVCCSSEMSSPTENTQPNENSLPDKGPTQKQVDHPSKSAGKLLSRRMYDAFLEINSFPRVI